MSAEAEDLVDQLKRKDLNQFVTLCKMHLSFLLDLSGSSLEEFLDNQYAESIPEHRFPGFGNFVRKKSFKELRNAEGCKAFGLLTPNVIDRIERLITFLGSKKNLIQEGLFRKNGHFGRQKLLRDKISDGKDIENDLETDVFNAYDCANVLKQFLGEMQEPLLSDKHYQAHCQVAEMQNEEKKLQTIQLLFHLLPTENVRLLRPLLFLLHAVASVKENLMTADTLGTLFAPHLLVPKKVVPSDLHKKNETMTRVISFMIEKAPLLFSLPEAVMQDIRTCLRDLETGKTPSQPCFSTPCLDARRMSSCTKIRGGVTDSSEMKTSISFTDRPATLRAAAETDTVRALGELYAHIANLPESSKKRKLLKQFNQASAISTTPVDNQPKPRRSKSLTQSLKNLVSHGRKSKAATADESHNVSSASTSCMSPSLFDLSSKQHHCPVIKQHASKMDTTGQHHRPPLARHLMPEFQRPLSILPSHVQLNSRNESECSEFLIPFHPFSGSIKGHSWTNLTPSSTDKAAPLPLTQTTPVGSIRPHKPGSPGSGITPTKTYGQSTETEFISPIKKHPPLRNLPPVVKKPASVRKFAYSEQSQT